MILSAINADSQPMILTSDEGYFEKIGGFMSWKMKCMDNQEKPCEYTLSEAEMLPS